MARHAVAVSATRAGFVARLNAALESGAIGRLPCRAAGLLDDPIAERLAALPCPGGRGLAARASRRKPRPRTPTGGPSGARTGRTWRSPTRRPASKRRSPAPAQQKALLIGVILGHAALIAAVRGYAPLLLLDEPAVHLDPAAARRCGTALGAAPAQAVLTGTDADAFAGLARQAECLRGRRCGRCCRIGVFRTPEPGSALSLCRS